MQDEVATTLKKELETAVLAKDEENKLRTVSQIHDSISWNKDLEQSGLFQDLGNLLVQFADQEPPSQKLVSLTKRTLRKLTKERDEINVREAYDLWWRDPPLSCSKDDSITVLFEDVTSVFSEDSTARRHRFQKSDEVWPVESVPASLDEPFSDLFVRFRTMANKKYRHPYRPALKFQVVLSNSSLLPVNGPDSTPVCDILPKLASYSRDNPARVAYIRNDEESPLNLPVWTIAPWDRTLPSWFGPAPPTWLTPSPPPAFSDVLPRPQVPFVRAYKMIPTLVIPGTGRNILPTSTTPLLISSHLYFIVNVLKNNDPDDEVPIYLFTPDLESDQSLTTDRFTPPLSLAQAKSLLGRAILFSTELFAEPIVDDKPKAKKRRTEVIKEKEAQEMGYAWGFDPDTMQLHCFSMVGNQNRDFVIDLNVRTSESPPRRWDALPLLPTVAPKKFIEWVGLVVLEEDKRVVASDSLPMAEPESQSKREEKEVEDTYRSLIDKVKSLNISTSSQLFEVEENDALLFGDVQIAKHEGQEGFETVVESVKPGTWAIHVEPDGVSLRGTLHLHWIETISLETSTTDWEPLSVFSIDSGSAGIFTQRAFADDGLLSSYGEDIEVTLETLMDFVLLGVDEDEGPHMTSFCLVVPGGVVCSVDDGTYEVLGKRDESGVLTAVKVVF